MNNDFLVTHAGICQWFSLMTLSLMKIICKSPHPKIVIHSNSCIILYLFCTDYEKIQQYHEILLDILMLCDQTNIFPIVNSQKEFGWFINFVVNTMPADGLAPLGARASADIVITTKLDAGTVMALVLSYDKGPGVHFKKAYELLNLRALKFSFENKMHIFQCVSKIFCVEFQRVPLYCCFLGPIHDSSNLAIPILPM